MTSRGKGTVYVLICVALWALIPVVSKMGQTTLDHHQFLFWSSLVSFMVLSGAAAFSGAWEEIKTFRPRDWGSLFFLGLLGTYIYYLFLYLGYSRATGMEVLVVQYTWPIFIVGLSMVILKEHLSHQKILAIVLGFTGVLLVLTKGEFQTLHVTHVSVMALVGAGAFCFALFSILSKNITRAPLGVTAIYFLSAAVASFLSMICCSDFALPSPDEIFPVLLNGVLVNGFSYVFWIIALRSAQASYLAPFTFITPALSAIYLILFFDEPFVPAYGAGLICVIAGGLVNSLSSGHPRT